MRIIVIALPALLYAGTAIAQGDPRDPRAKAPPVEFRSAFEGYKPFADQELRDWRKSNEEIGVAGGHTDHGSGQASGKPTSKPQPGQQGGHK